jgi:hypothetical protein
VIEFCTVTAKVPPVDPMTIDAGEYVGAAHVKPAMGAGVNSVTEQVLPVGMPVTVALPPDANDLWPVNAVLLVSRPQS